MAHECGRARARLSCSLRLPHGRPRRRPPRLRQARAPALLPPLCVLHTQVQRGRMGGERQPRSVRHDAAEHRCSVSLGARVALGGTRLGAPVGVSGERVRAVREPSTRRGRAKTLALFFCSGVCAPSAGGLRGRRAASGVKRSIPSPSRRANNAGRPARGSGARTSTAPSRLARALSLARLQTPVHSERVLRSVPHRHPLPRAAFCARHCSARAGEGVVCKASEMV